MYVPGWMPFYLERACELVKPLEVGVGVYVFSSPVSAQRSWPGGTTQRPPPSFSGILLAVVVSCCGKSLEGPGTATGAFLTGAGRLSHAVGTTLSETVRS